MKLKEIIIRKMTLDNTGSTTIIKRVLSFIIFLITISMAILVLFKIKDKPLNLEEFRQVGWWLLMIVLIMLIGKKANYNLHISYNGYIVTSLMTSLFISLAIVFTFTRKDNVIRSWGDYQEMFYWYIGVTGANIIWKWMFVFFDRKTRPFFALEQLYKSLAESGAFIFYVLGRLVFKHLIIEKNSFDYQNPLVLTWMLGSGVMFVLGIFAGVKSYKYVNKNKINTRLRRIGNLWNAVYILIPITIWFLSRISFSSLGVNEDLFIVVGIILFGLVLVSAFAKKEGGRSSKIYLLTSMSVIFVAIIFTFIFMNWINANTFCLIGILLVLLLALALVNIIIEPETPAVFSTIYKVMFYLFALFVLLLWVTQWYISKEITEIPLNIDSILFVPTIVLASVLELIIIFTTLHTFNVIHMQSHKFGKHIRIQEIKLKGASHE